MTLASKQIDFICIGAQKAGTTWLYQRLKSLPDFSMPPIKEIHYFDRSPTYPTHNKLAITTFKERKKNAKWLGNVNRLIENTDDKFIADWYKRFYLEDYNDEWYLSLFNDLDGITGDITPGYSILSEKDVSHLFDLLPDVKIIFLLRNPVDRAWSQFRYLHGARTISLDKMKSFLNTPNQLLKSDYLSTLKIYEGNVRQNQIMIGFYDAIKNNPLKFLKEIVSFLGGQEDQLEKANLSNIDNASQMATIPQDLRQYLNEKYSSSIHQLSERFGSYASVWRKQLADQNYIIPLKEMKSTIIL